MCVCVCLYVCMCGCRCKRYTFISAMNSIEYLARSIQRMQVIFYHAMVKNQPLLV